MWHSRIERQAARLLRESAALDGPRGEKSFRPLTKQPEYLTGGTLMDFQMEGVNFLRR